MQSISQNEFESLLHDTGRCQFISLTAVTTPDMRKRNNPFASVARKVSIIRGVINSQYTSTVNRQRRREGRADNFKAIRRRWGTRIRHTPLVSHAPEATGETVLYLEVKIEQRHDHYFDRETHKRIPDSELGPFLRDRDEGSRQQVDRSVVLRDFKLASVAEITIAGTRYTITPAATELQNYFPPARSAVATARRKRNARRQTAKGVTCDSRC